MLNESINLGYVEGVPKLNWRMNQHYTQTSTNMCVTRATTTAAATSRAQHTTGRRKNIGKITRLHLLCWMDVIISLHEQTIKLSGWNGFVRWRDRMGERKREKAREMSKAEDDQERRRRLKWQATARERKKNRFSLMSRINLSSVKATYLPRISAEEQHYSANSTPKQIYFMRSEANVEKNMKYRQTHTQSVSECGFVHLSTRHAESEQRSNVRPFILFRRFNVAVAWVCAFFSLSLFQLCHHGVFYTAGVIIFVLPFFLFCPMLPCPNLAILQRRATFSMKQTQFDRSSGCFVRISYLFSML